MSIEKNDLINLLKNRRVFDKQYRYNTMQWLQHFSKDKLALFLWIILLAFIVYKVINDSSYIGFIGLSATLFFFVLFIFYAFRAHAYKNFTKESDELTLSVYEKILKGSIRAIYVPKISNELSEHIIDFLMEDPLISEQVKWILNTHRRRGNKTEFNIKKCSIINAVKDKFNIDIEFGFENLEPELISLGRFKVTQTYTNYEQLKKLEVSTNDIPWLICRVAVMSILIGSFLLFIIIFNGWI
jgi:cbb3-type cytochrome oxidase subunit 3